MTWYTGNTMVLRFLQTIPSLGGIYHTNTNSYQTIPITAETVCCFDLQPFRVVFNRLRDDIALRIQLPGMCFYYALSFA
jgi:hypothetical protein